MYTVYALKSIGHNWIYVGMTDNLQRRVGQHQAKQNTNAQYYAPFIVFTKQSLYPGRRQEEKYPNFQKGTTSQLALITAIT